MVLIFNCSQLRDGFDETAPFVGRYCHADAIPPPFVSSSNMLWVKFASDASINAGGFRATYELSKWQTFVFFSNYFKFHSSLKWLYFDCHIIDCVTDDVTCSPRSNRETDFLVNFSFAISMMMSFANQWLAKQMIDFRCKKVHLII